jgi:DNA-binding transcriptional regulator YiaG
MAPELMSLLRMFGLPSSDIQRILVSVDAPRAAKVVRADENRRAVPTGGDLLHAMRSRAGLKLPEISHMLDVAPSTVSRWESSTAHPTRKTLDKYLEIVGASPAERETLFASGVGKLKSTRRPFNAFEYADELNRMERTIRLGGEIETELRLLQIQSNLWWADKEPEAEALLRRAYVLYAAHLAEWVRFKEAVTQTERALEYGDCFDELGIEAQRIQGLATTYKGPTVRPHQGLCILQPCLVRAESGPLRISVLIDMADLSMLAGRQSEAISYAERAVLGARGRDEALNALARGAWATANESIDALRQRPSEPWLACTYLLREFNLLSAAGRIEEADQISRALKELALLHGLRHFLSKLALAEKRTEVRGTCAD